ncbi:MAG: sensor domain-containing diguanylate cyclase [Armatimonadetes bacterium]|nr:sensor domain-containing diguanylate cyclase [Armatimonadota bacterium]
MTPGQLEKHQDFDMYLDADGLTRFNEVFRTGGVRYALARPDGTLVEPALEEFERCRLDLVDGGLRPSVALPGMELSCLPVQVADHTMAFLLELREAGATAPLSTRDFALELVSRETRLRYELQSTLEELISKYEELTVLYDSAETVATIMNLDEVSHRILIQAADILDVDHASLMLLDDDGQYLEVKAARGTRSDLVGKIRVAIGEEISGYVAQEGKPVLIEDLRTDPQFSRVSRQEDEARSLISVPLKVKDRILGVLNVNNKKSGEPFDSGDLKLLMALAQLAAISIENARTYQNAITDRLTSLYNYGYFREQLDHAMRDSGKEGQPLSLLMFDIDHFKNFNDVNGHELANVALVGVASLCIENSRQKKDRVPDLVARYGGEEFMIILYGVGKDEAYSIAERIRSRVADARFQGGENQPMGKVTISMGVATYPEDALNGDDLIHAADQALYRAKRSGRNNVQRA